MNSFKCGDFREACYSRIMIGYIYFVTLIFSFTAIRTDIFIFFFLILEIEALFNLYQTKIMLRKAIQRSLAKPGFFQSGGKRALPVSSRLFSVHSNQQEAAAAAETVKPTSGK